MADTGEFIAISVTNEQPQIAAAQLAGRVSALSEQLEVIISAHHDMAHDGPVEWRSCTYITCRTTKEILDAEF